MKERFRRFMQGRYGVDEFSRFLSGAGLVCMLIATVLSFFEARATYYISSLCMSLAWFCLLWSLFRLFSRNYGRRYAENNWYLQKKARVTGWLQTRRIGFVSGGSTDSSVARSAPLPPVCLGARERYASPVPAAATVLSAVPDKTHL